MTNLSAAIEHIKRQKGADPRRDKEWIQANFIEQFAPLRRRSVYVGNGYAIRFCEAGAGGFSNTVLSLSALEAHDTRPFVVVVIRQNGVDFLLANATFLRKISHSSLQLRADNIRGSFNGSDIETRYDGIANVPENFDQLFALHCAFTWQENVERLVEATNNIVARNARFTPSEAEKEIILAAPARAALAMASPAFRAIEGELQDTLAGRIGEVVQAAQIDNVNLRGNAIEQILTRGLNRHELGDLMRNIDEGQLVIDIKTKLSDRASAPKAYNVDKMLTFIALPSSVFAFFIVVVDPQLGTATGRLLPIFEKSLLSATGVQHHWAGRASRGVTQLSGPFAIAIAADYVPAIDAHDGQGFLRRLLAL